MVLNFFEISCRPANLENIFRGTFRVKKRDLPAKSGTVGRAHIQIFLEVGPIGLQPPEINCVPKYTVARRFGRGTVWYRTDIIIQSYSLYNSFLREIERNFRNYVQLGDLHQGTAAALQIARRKKNPTSYKKWDIS